MAPTDDFDSAWHSLKADIEAAAIVLRGLMKAHLGVCPLGRSKMIDHIREELADFRADAHDAGWSELVAALVEAHLDELMRDPRTEPEKD